MCGFKGVVFYFFPGKDTFSMKISKKEWVSEISGIFFFPPPTFSGKKKIRIVYLRSPFWWQQNLITRCEFVFSRNCNSSYHFFSFYQWVTGHSRHNLNFWPVFFFSRDWKKKIPQHSKRSEWVGSVSFPGKK